MDEFALIKTYFQSISPARADVVFGIGDDAACLRLSSGLDLLVSCDTLISGVHFLPDCDPYDLACKALRVTLSDIAAMGGTPCWALLALTLPLLDKRWLQAFSKGLQESLTQFGVVLIGGDTTRGPLSMTLTVHGTVSEGKAVRRHGAKPCDLIYVSGELGAAALAVAKGADLNEPDRTLVMRKLFYPEPRFDLGVLLCEFATASIDISDGLSADLSHLCEASGVGACIALDNIPIHPVVKRVEPKTALNRALAGGEDYELCFTIPFKREAEFLDRLSSLSKRCYPIGCIEGAPGLRSITESGEVLPLSPLGYRHF